MRKATGGLTMQEGNRQDATLPGGVDTAEVSIDEFCGALASRDMAGLWSRPPMPAHPMPQTRAHLWRWDTVAPLARQAGSVLGVDEGAAQRRALQFCNPGLRIGTTEALFGAYQYLDPGEKAPAHRHSPAAIRFMMTGSSVYTTVDGDACWMEPGDFVLTPSWAWHDHTNQSDEPAIWLDVIDVVMVATLESIFFEDHPTGMQDVAGFSLSEEKFGHAGLQHSDGAAWPKPYSPLLRYPYAQVDAALEALQKQSDDSSVTVEYKNPVTGGPALPTLTCQMTRIRPGKPTAPRRQTGGQIHTVFRGRGRSVIGGKEFTWGPGDVFVVPSWVPVEHEAEETADLFVGSDRAALEALHLYREAELPAQQQVTGIFEPASAPESDEAVPAVGQGRREP
ncbi:cupin domain-containing protein [Streptomyces fulvoviolaceus]|uniref:cupin domain-containing protein n=1 Tax=Streptomyces fulvoviolaceus TaxID=285535 RepID=UPI000995F469|nr:cupin domain-containing protein [Streptomyces fulvoviolaceus]